MKGIAGLIISIFSIISLIGYLSFAINVTTDASKIIQGDPSGASDLAETASDEIVSTIEWEVGKTVAIAFCSVLGLGVLVKIFKRI